MCNRPKRWRSTRCLEPLFEVAGASWRCVEGLDHGKPPLTLMLLGVASNKGKTDHFSRSRRRCVDRAEQWFLTPFSGPL
jgi:hypothetical protein